MLNLFIVSIAALFAAQAQVQVPLQRMAMHLDDNQIRTKGIVVRFPGNHPSEKTEPFSKRPMVITDSVRDSNGSQSLILNEGAYRIDFGSADLPFIEERSISANQNVTTLRFIYQPFAIDGEDGLFVMRVSLAKSDPDKPIWFVDDVSRDALWISELELRDVANRLDDAGNDDALVALLVSQDYASATSFVGHMLMAGADLLKDAGSACCADPNTATQVAPPGPFGFESSSHYEKLEDSYFQKQEVVLTELLGRRQMLESYSPDFRQAIVKIVFQEVVAAAISNELSTAKTTFETMYAGAEITAGAALIRNHRPFVWIGKRTPFFKRFVSSNGIWGKARGGFKGFGKRLVSRIGGAAGVFLIWQGIERLELVYRYNLDPGWFPALRPLTIPADVLENARARTDSVRPFQKKASEFFEEFGRSK